MLGPGGRVGGLELCQLTLRGQATLSSRALLSDGFTLDLSRAALSCVAPSKRFAGTRPRVSRPTRAVFSTCWSGGTSLLCIAAVGWLCSVQVATATLIILNVCLGCPGFSCTKARV